MSVFRKMSATSAARKVAIVLLNDARRFLKPDGVFIPQRCETRIAAIQMPDEFLRDPSFDELGGYHAEQTWRGAGYKHDFRLCVTGTSREMLRSTADVFEDLDFTQPRAGSYEREVRMKITQHFADRWLSALAESRGGSRRDSRDARA